ncbi:protein of unknown function (plasmid) [Caballeronia sp. S22]
MENKSRATAARPFLTPAKHNTPYEILNNDRI